MEDFPLYNYKMFSLEYSHPKESRFKKLMEEMKPKRKRKPKSMQVDPKNVALGIDKRTSIVIKNIPKDISTQKFYELLLSLCPEINYYYVPVNIKSRKKLRVAFVDVNDCKNIVPIFMGLYKMKFDYGKPNINMEICYSKYQGRHRLIQRFLCDKPFMVNNK